jgi:hypothetical protein
MNKNKIEKPIDYFINLEKWNNGIR